MDEDDQIAQIVAITGAEPDAARHLLEAANGQVEAAVQLHFDGGVGHNDDFEDASEALVRQLATGTGPAEPGGNMPSAGGPLDEMMDGTRRSVPARPVTKAIASNPHNRCWSWHRSGHIDLSRTKALEASEKRAKSSLLETAAQSECDRLCTCAGQTRCGANGCTTGQLGEEAWAACLQWGEA